MVARRSAGQFNGGEGHDQEIDQIHQKIFSIEKDRFIAVSPAQNHTINYAGSPSFATVIALDNDCVSVGKEWVKDLIIQYESVDDVFRKPFLQGVIFTGPRTVDITPGAHEFLRSMANTWIEVLDKTSSETIPPPGPYFVTNHRLYEVWKLYDDFSGAFMAALVPHANKTELSQLRISGKEIQNISIAVPSRLVGSKTPEKRLQGLRIAVKDIFKVRGQKTSVCNRAYYSLYPPATETAACVEILEREGACLLGTTKLAAFAATEEPIECVDYQAPWNPRADGYQSPAGSSSGSGAAIASYEWLDIAIGSDTSGSGRRPGHWNGCYAMRPSHGVLPIEGYVPSFEQFDTPTFFGRELEKCKAFSEVWYGNKLSRDQTSLPPSIIYPTDYMSLITNKEQMSVIEKFIIDLESSLGVQHEKVSFNELWDDDPPKAVKGERLQEYMKDACRNSFFHDDYHNLDKFREDYQSRFSKEPYVSPPVRWQWALSSRIASSERDIAVDRLAVYEKWFQEKVLQIGKRHTIVLIPIENMSARYRDEPLGHYFNPVGVPMLFIAPILKAPELTVPIGQVPFNSRVTGRVENLPVTISLLSSPGRDLELFDIAHDCLTKAGRPLNVLAGTPEMFA